MKQLRVEIIWIIGLLVLFAILFIIVFCNRVIKVNTIVLTSDKIDKDMDIIFVSDFHVGEFMRKRELEEIVSLINTMEGDVLLIGGDMVGKKPLKCCEEEELKNILLDVLDTPVSPELLPPVDGAISQKTEDLVGPYELHDFFLYYLLRWGYEPAKIYRLALKAFAGQYEKETILKWLKIFCRRFFQQQFKRSCLPDGPKVGSVGVSPRGDLKMPSDAAATLWLRQIEALEAEK